MSIDVTRKKRGRPKTTGSHPTITVRLPPESLAVIDAFIAKQPDPKPSRSEVIREAIRALHQLGGL
jgi:hypothetical protein